MDMTLREVCETFEVSRRAVQGYEKAGLVSASKKNERGYLLYDANSQERIRQIRLFQRMGFSIKEIKNIIDSSNDILKSSLEKQTRKLELKKKELEMLLVKMYEMIEEL